MVSRGPSLRRRTPLPGLLLSKRSFRPHTSHKARCMRQPRDRPPRRPSENLLLFTKADQPCLPVFSRRYTPNLGQRESIFLLTSASILISSGQGRVKPSEGNLRVASTPILEPKLGRRGKRLRLSLQATINVSPVANLYDQDRSAVVFDHVNNTIVPRTKSEELPQPLKPFHTRRTWICR